MSDFRNIFTRVQARGPVYAGTVDPALGWPRQGGGGFSHLLGRFGDAQIGPVYLGWTGIASLGFGFAAIEIIGLNMLASVNWSPIEFVRQLPWLALEPPGPEWGITIPPMAFLTFDFSSCEVKILAALCKDEAMMDACAKGWDFHSFTASMIAGVPYEDFVAIAKDEHHPEHKKYKGIRQDAKATTFERGGLTQ